MFSAVFLVSDVCVRRNIDKFSQKGRDQRQWLHPLFTEQSHHQSGGARVLAAVTTAYICLNCCCHDFIRVCSTLPRWSLVPPLMAGLGFLVLIYSLCLIHIGGHSQLSATVHQSTSVTKYIHGSELGLKTYLSDLHYCPPGCTLSLHVRNLSKQKYFVKILAAHFPAHRKYDQKTMF